MTDNLSPTPSNLPRSEWQRLYNECKGWKSEIDFFSDELRFFVHLVDRYFLELVHDLESADLSGLAMKIHAAQKDQKIFSEDISEHMPHLKRLTEFPEGADAYEHLKRHEQLREYLGRFFSEIKYTKSKVFEEIEEVIRHSKELKKASHKLD